MKRFPALPLLLCGLLPLSCNSSPKQPAKPDKATTVDAPAAATPAATSDSAAITALHHLSDAIAKLHSVSFTLRVAHDVQDPDYGTITRFSTDRVHMTGPDRMHVDVNGHKRHRGYWYNGHEVTYLDYQE